MEENEDRFTDILLKYGLTNSSSSTSRSFPLHSAVGNTECVLELMSAGADINKRYNTWTALAFALRDGNMRSAAALVAHGANVNSTDKFGNTDLMWTAKVCDTEQLSFLLNHGAGVNLVNHNKESALILAAAQNKTDNVRCLIKFGADVQLADATGWSALFWAIFYGNVDIVCCLLCAGASVNVRDRNGETVLQKALVFGHMKCAVHLHASGAVHPENGSSILTDLLDVTDAKMDMSLKHSCGELIRGHLLKLHKDSNLFALVKYLEYPSSLKKYLLYGCNLDDMQPT